jgi:hypothetical protein
MQYSALVKDNRYTNHINPNKAFQTNNPKQEETAQLPENIYHKRRSQ